MSVRAISSSMKCWGMRPATLSAISGWRWADSGVGRRRSQGSAVAVYRDCLDRNSSQGDGGGRSIRVRPGSRRNMLAGTDPDRTLDTPRLSDFSPKREKSHGASSVGRIRPHQCSHPPTDNRRSQTSGSTRSSARNPTIATSCGRIRPLFAICPPACAVRLIGETRWPDFPRHRSSPLSRSGAVPRAAFGSCSGEHVFFASRGRTRKPPRATAVPERKRGEQREAAKRGKPN